MAENRVAGFYGEGELRERVPIPDQPISVLSPPGLVSIIIPCCGQLEHTKLCVPSVMRHSRAPFELIFVDIGSLDGTAAYLAGVQAVATVRVEVLRATTDLGIANACKEAIDQARGEYLVLLNNDTVVTDAWLNQMIALASTSPTIGMVGPMSNYSAPPQLVEAVPYRFGPRKSTRKDAPIAGDLLDVSAVNKFAAQWRETHRGKWLEAERLGGFCLLIKRHVLQKIGSLDAWTDLSLFDTDILSGKAREAGFTLACCRDLFIHHFGSRTFTHGAPDAALRAQAPTGS
jgi:GT2 family glycosyltransferase